VPVCVSGRAGAAAVCHILTEPRQTLTVASGCAPWVFVNAGARGYYRTAYTPDMLRTMAPRVETDLTPAERFSLIDDEWALVRAGRHSIADYLALITGFAREHTSGILDDVTDRLGYIHEYLTTPATAPRLEAFARGLFRPLFEEVGFTASGSEPDDRRALRAAVVLALGTTGNDPDVVAKSRAALDRALAGSTPLDPTMASAMTTIAADHGDGKLYDALAAAAGRATSPEEHYRALYALARFREPSLVDRGLQRTLTSELRTQDVSLYLARFFNNAAARERAWQFVKTNWSALEPKVTIFGGDTNLIRALGSFCDAATRDDITAFFAAHKLPSAGRTLGQTVEQIDNCIALRAAQAPTAETWLQQRP
jgi:aminopeptidase N/puromycin-sensitive aminopeptidase